MNVQQQISEGSVAVDWAGLGEVDAAATARAAARAAEQAALARTRPLGDGDVAAPIGDEDDGCAASGAMLLKNPQQRPKPGQQPIPGQGPGPGQFPFPGQPYPGGVWPPGSLT